MSSAQNNSKEAQLSTATVVHIRQGAAVFCHPASPTTSKKSLCLQYAPERHPLICTQHPCNEATQQLVIHDFRKRMSWTRDSPASRWCMVSSWSSRVRALCREASRPAPLPPQMTPTRRQGPKMRAHRSPSASAFIRSLSAASSSCCTHMPHICISNLRRGFLAHPWPRWIPTSALSVTSMRTPHLWVMSTMSVVGCLAHALLMRE